MAMRTAGHGPERWATIALAGSALLGAGRCPGAERVPPAPGAPGIPVVCVTDLYHPAQDVGDNFDLLLAYGLEGIDLRAVVLDVTEECRDPGLHGAERPAHDPGFIPVTQLNYIFGRNVPCGVGPFVPMTSPSDSKKELSQFESSGVDLLLRVLRESPEPVDVLSFGSARAIAVAYNRDPALVQAKVGRVHLCAGSTAGRTLEWNVRLDPRAVVAVLRSPLPVAVYPCATEEGPFAYAPSTCYWRLPDLSFCRELDPHLQSYLTYAFTDGARTDFLRAMDEPPAAAQLDRWTGKYHNVWETGVWLEVSGRVLVQDEAGHARIARPDQVRSGDRVLTSRLEPVEMKVDDEGFYTFAAAGGPTRRWVYTRGDALANERALREALPALMKQIRVPARGR